MLKIRGRRQFFENPLLLSLNKRQFRILKAFDIDVNYDMVNVMIRNNSNTMRLSAYQSRENCRCDSCTIYPSNHRAELYYSQFIDAKNDDIINIDDALIDNIKINNISIDYELERFNFEWSDNHFGFLNFADIFKNQIQPSNIPNSHYYFQEKHMDFTNLIIDKIENDSWKLLDNSFSPNQYDYDKLLNCHNNISYFNHFYDSFCKNGLVFIGNAPCQQNTVLKLLQSICYHCRSTVFGNSFIVKDKGKEELSANAAYSTAAISGHTDCSYYINPINGFIFHCIVPAMVGGESYYIDSYNIIKDMRVRYPKQFNLLCNIPILFRDKQINYDLYAFQYIVRLKPMIQICFSELTRYSLYNDKHLYSNNELYKAIRLFYRYVQHPKYQYKYLMKSSDIVMFQNDRILHGRNTFSGYREFEGAYFDMQNLFVKKNTINI